MNSPDCCLQCSKKGTELWAAVQESRTARSTLTPAQAYTTSAMCILQFNLVSTYNFMQVELQLLEPACFVQLL